MPWLREFFQDVDRSWAPGPSVQKIRLRVIGSVALMMQSSYARGTKDGDVLETAQLAGELRDRLLALAGPDTPIAVRHGLYIDIVASGLPFLPQAPLCHARQELNATLLHFEIEVLDVVDVVVSKLKRFSASDRSDIEAMIDNELVPHERFIERFKAAVDWTAYDAKADDIPKYVRALHTVERDMFGVAETEIDLPGWLQP